VLTLEVSEHGDAHETSRHPTPTAGYDRAYGGLPLLLSILPRPVPPPGYSYRNFSEKGSWQGPHSLNPRQHNPDVEKQGNQFDHRYFNAGLRIFDVWHPRSSQEIGYFIPPDPAQRYGPMPERRLVVQTEDVVVDRRGFTYITDKSQGLWVL
jgi:hypothetical protein